MLNGLIMVNEVPGKQWAELDHFKQKQKGLDTDTNRAMRIAAQMQKGLWLQTTPLQITQVNPDEKGALNPQEFSLPADVKHRKTGQTYEQESFLIFCLFQFLYEFPVPPKENSQWLYQDLWAKSSLEI